MAATKKPAAEKPAAKQPNPNIALWDSLEKTPPSATKKGDVNGQKLTTVNGLAMVKAATAAFGPVGIGWGYRIDDERFDNAGPIIGTRWDKDTGQNLPGEKLTDALVHTMRVTVWYKHNGEVGEVTHFGHTPYIYRSKHGFSVDQEAPKKSLTDAIKKCLSLIGVFADVWLGLFDDPLYVAEAVQTEAAVKKGGVVEELKLWAESESKKYEACPTRKTLDNYFNSHCNTLAEKAGARKLSQEEFDEVKAVLQQAYDARLEAAAAAAAEAAAQKSNVTQGQQGGINQ